MASIRVIDRSNGSRLVLDTRTLVQEYRLLECERADRTETYLQHIVSEESFGKLYPTRKIPKRIPVPVSIRTIDAAHEWYLGFGC